MGEAAEDLFRLRRIFVRAMRNLAAFAHDGEILSWADEASHEAQDPDAAKVFFTPAYWVQYARGRKLCGTCGWNLNNTRVKCPYDYRMCPSFDPSETGFEYMASDARVVEVAGSFSRWQPIPLKQLEAGIWGVRVRIEPGVCQYKFIVDGQWRTDPVGRVEHDTAGNMNSVLFVRDS
jgi:hypothetical protein